MGNSPESIVRNFLATFTDRKVDELIGFFSDDAVFIDGPRGAHRGREAIRSEFATGLALDFESIQIDVNSLAANGGLEPPSRPGPRSSPSG